MAEKKIIKVEETKKKESAINTDDLKKIGTAILTFIVANPELVSKLLEKPASMLKKIIGGEDISSDTKKKVNKKIASNKQNGLSSILTAFSSDANDSDVSNIFDKISNTISTGELVNSVGSILGKNSNNKKKSSSSGLGSIISNLFK